MTQYKRSITVALSDNFNYMSFDSILRAMLDAKARAEKEGLRNLNVDCDLDYGSCYYQSDTPSISVKILAQRDETDEEFNLRVQQEEAQKKAREVSDYEQYMKLRQKFEKKK